MFFLGMAWKFLNAEIRYLLLAVGAFLPSVFGTLVATNVDILRREDVHHLIDDILREPQGLCLAGAQHVLKYTKATSHLVRTARASQFRIRGKRRQHMSRHVNLRNHRDISVSGIFHDFARLLLSVISRYRHSVKLVIAALHDGLLSLGTNLVEHWVFLYLKPPALVFREMPVEVIDVVHGEDIN